jgi:hypothetical protein
MADPIITNNDLGSVILKDAQFRDEALTFGGAGTEVEGTILARKAVDDAVAASAVTGTGDGTVTAGSVVAGPIVPLVGAYVLNCIEAVVNGGIWELVDPNGALVATNLIMTVGAGAATVFEAGGLTFTITDGTTDFAVADTATLTVVANGKMVPFAIGGLGGAQFPKEILTYDVTAAGAGDEQIRGMISGSVRKERLIISADGTGANITDAILDDLRNYGIISTDVQELNILDNQ